ncbi:MAG: LysM peptidoglycan-binding domain-containing protein [Roseiflexus sp.]|jgi:nucleoid-associated protein YgaU|nr:LysM peptidoglycan-binding domain-containing protein [Roseiflexus sp.]
MPDTSLVKAKIINLDDPSQEVECLFNPKEYTFTKQNSWSRGETPSTNVPQLEFSGGQPATLSMHLLFDTYTSARPGSKPRDVRKVYTDKLWSFMMIDQNLQDPKSTRGRPPKVRFQWGTSWSFKAVITNITQKFTLFLVDGTPVRAELDVTFQQIEDTANLQPQNPTSGGVGGERVWRVRDGDTLAWIAYKSYGDATRWRPIAEANGLERVRELTPGAVLVIPHE